MPRVKPVTTFPNLNSVSVWVPRQQGIGRHHPEGEQEGRRERLEVMRTSNPAFILRAKALDQALNAAQDGGDPTHVLPCSEIVMTSLPPKSGRIFVDAAGASEL